MEEEKNRDSDDVFADAGKQNSDTKFYLRNKDKIGEIRTGDGTEIPKSDFELAGIAEEDILRIGADEKFDVVNFDETQVDAITETFELVTNRGS